MLVIIMYVLWYFSRLCLKQLIFYDNFAAHYKTYVTSFIYWDVMFVDIFEKQCDTFITNA